MRRVWIAEALTIVLLGAAHTLGQGLPTADPERVGMSEPALSMIRPAMQRFVDDGRVAGVVTLVARKGRVVHVESVGHRELGAEALRPDDIFRIASMTKPITSVAVMMLVEEGRVGLDDPISKHLPEFAATQVDEDGELVPAAGPITVRDLLGHTSGLTYGFFGSTRVDSLYREAKLFSRGDDLEAFVKAVAALPLLAQPGTVWNYSVSTDVLGRLVEVASDMPFDEFLEHRIFRPLGMNDTGFFVPDDRQDRFTVLYTDGEDGLQLSDAPDTGRYSRPPVFLSGGGGLVSTAPDYARFAQMLLDGGALAGVRLLDEESVRKMRTNRLRPDELPVRVGDEWAAPGYGFGLGFSVLVDAQADEGPGDAGIFRWWGYASTYFWIDPNEELIGIVLTQVVPPTVPDLAETFQRLVYASLLAD